ncbi:prolyl aminopeptidase [Lipingzhangella sp. LS1_29]|uniref:Proline iminopeptidase n=1 Tax=Lipingzhangella rawalii TaxID=2055835 RepID=A0ABU2H7L8_9ACTN|nr:prolyl aminopeptidase [Lipingzhangella rawalii]MDS1271302.1 prolyl aminopeptidase [Lipingzhangella rawalii]
MTPTHSGYPQTEPHTQGMLDVGDDNLVYFDVSGNPSGKPVVLLHGGPGAGAVPGLRRFFDPSVYRIVSMDQRGCGRSRPHASRPDTPLDTNTTHHLIADLELVRRHLGIERWQVFGGSWGCTLGLAYAQRFPTRVTELVLLAVTTTRRAEIDWLTRDLGRLLPEQWQRFNCGVPVDERCGDLAAAYARLLDHPDAAVRDRAARHWCAWEDAVVMITPGVDPDPRFNDPEYRMAFARLVTHYFSHGAWLTEGELLHEAHRLAGIPGVLVHGRLDLSAPLDTAWQLASAWPDGELVVVENAGHSSGHSGMAEAVIRATDRFAAH